MLDNCAACQAGWPRIVSIGIPTAENAPGCYQTSGFLPIPFAQLLAFQWVGELAEEFFGACRGASTRDGTAAAAPVQEVGRELAHIML
jgi:hypothetical protein